MIFFNIHSHRFGTGECERTIRSIFPEELEIIANSAEIPPGNLISSGIHPRFPGKTSEIDEKLHILEEFSRHPIVAAIGECGLDRLSEIPIARQSGIFEAHCGISENAGKPLVIHCVRAYPELISLKKDLSPRQKWIAHGFRGGMEIAEQLVGHGIMVSFGPALRNSRKLADVFAAIPLDFIFLETDDSPEKIGDLYGTASKIRNESVDYIAEQMRGNSGMFGFA